MEEKRQLKAAEVIKIINFFKYLMNIIFLKICKVLILLIYIQEQAECTFLPNGRKTNVNEKELVKYEFLC